MSAAAPALFAAAAALACLGILDLRQPGRGSRKSAAPRARQVPAAALSLGLPERIRRAGRDGYLSPRSVLVTKGLTAATGLCFGLVVVPAIPGRVGTLLLAGSVAAGFLLPDYILERAARRRHRRIVNSLPDALDLLAISVATGRSIGAGMLELAGSGRGPLALELARTGQDLAWGAGQSRALGSLRRRVGGKEVASFCATIERSRRLGSPLAEQLRRQSSGLRQDQRRRIEDEAARAAPKIQLVIALVLVPSVLLLMAAALIANSDSLLGIGYAVI